MQTDAGGRVARDQRHGLGQAQPGNLIQAQGGRQQAAGDVIGRQDIHQPQTRQLNRRDIARVRAAAHYIGPAHDGDHAACVRSLRRKHSRWEFAHACALGVGLIHMRHGGVVVAGQRDAMLFAIGGEIGAVRLRVAHLVFARQRYAGLKFFAAPAFFPAEIHPGMVDVFPLPLARRVVHHRNHAHQGVVFEGLEQ